MSVQRGYGRAAIARLDTAPRLGEFPWRWMAIGVFGLSSALNFLDRQLLAAAAPALKAEFSLSNTEYGYLVSAFSIAYMVVAPLAGLLIDRVGLKHGSIIAVTAWSIAGMCTGFVRSFSGLFTVRMGLGIAEAAGIPSSSKASAMYLKPQELGLGNAVQSIDVTLGAIAAPLLIAAFMPQYGWRSVFVACGAIGLLWGPLWALTSRKISASAPTLEPPVQEGAPVADVLSDRRLWALVAASILVMTIHSLWMNWTTLYLVQERHLSLIQANRYFAWIPPIFGTLGGLAGGWRALRLIRSGKDAVRSRLRICFTAAPLLLLTPVIPFLPSAELAIAGISLSFFACMMVIINVHVIPIDLFGVKRAAFTSSILVSSYALMQALVSPGIGFLVDNSSFAVVCLLMSLLSLTGVGLLRLSFR